MASKIEATDSAGIYAALTELFRDLFSDDTIVLTPQTTAADIDGWDSFTHLTVIVSAETRFGIRIKTTEIDKLANVGQLVEAIQAKLPG